MAIVVVVVTFAAIGAGNREITLGDLNEGDCFVLSDDAVQTGVTVFDLIDCEQALRQAAVGAGLAALVLEVGTLGNGRNGYPPDDELLQMVDVRCNRYLSRSPSVLPLLPDERAWATSEGPYVCLSVSLG
jgi:hypothetical protein